MAKSFTENQIFALQEKYLGNGKNDLVGLYKYMFSEGYAYANMALGVVTQDTGAGRVAVIFMTKSAETQGVTITPNLLTSIEVSMAKGWLTTLAQVAKDNGVVSDDLNFKQTEHFHSAAFKENTLGPESWTLYAPGQVFGDINSEIMWKDILKSNGSFLNFKADMENMAVAANMENCAVNCSDAGTKNIAQNWLDTLLQTNDPANEGYGDNAYELHIGASLFGANSQYLNGVRLRECFLAGTPVLMSDGSEKPIEDIEIGDEVMAFDPLTDQGKGQKTSRKVTRLFRNVTNKILDLHGLKMTPGHVVLTDQGEWLTIARVLKADRAIVKEIDGKPVEIRARTGRPIGSAEDIPVNVVFRDPVTRRQQVATVRAGIPAIAHTYAGKTELWTLGKVLAHQNYKLEADGTIFDASGAKFDATPWPGSTPFESEIMHNWIISVEGRSYTPQWIADLPLEDEKNASTAGAVQDGASYGSPQTMNRHERRRMAALRVVK